MMPLTKLFFQFIIASVLIWAGFVIPIFDIFFSKCIFFNFWIILIINSVNMFDNIDGATGTFCLTLFLFFTIRFILECRFKYYFRSLRIYWFNYYLYNLQFLSLKIIYGRYRVISISICR